jgi:hypothetical protein
MAQSGHGIPSLQFRLVDGVLRPTGATQQRPVDVCFSTSPAGMGSMAAAVAALRCGATVTVDMRGGAFQALQQALNAKGVHE